MRKPVSRWCISLAAAMVATVAAACGSSTPSASGKATTTVSNTTTTVVPAPTLRSMLLTAADLPVGWAPTSNSGGGTLTGCSFHKFGHVLSKASASFGAPSGFPQWDEELDDVAPGVAQQALDSAIATLDGCHSLGLPVGNGRTLTVTLTPLTVPTVGNQSGAWSLTGEDQGQAFTFYVMIARFDSIGGTFFYGLLGSSGESAFLSLAERSGVRVESMLGSGAAGGSVGPTGVTGGTGYTGGTGASGIS